MLTCHPSQKFDILVRMFPTLHCLNMSTCHPSQKVDILINMYLILCHIKCRPVTPPRRSTYWPENVFYTSLPQYVNLAVTCHRRSTYWPEYVSYTSLPQNVDLSPCHSAKKVDILTSMFPAPLIFICIELVI